MLSAEKVIDTSVAGKRKNRNPARSMIGVDTKGIMSHAACGMSDTTDGKALQYCMVKI
jgi:hypothetical protein